MHIKKITYDTDDVIFHIFVNDLLRVCMVKTKTILTREENETELNSGDKPW